MSHEKPTAVGGKIMTAPMRVLMVVALIGLFLTAWRFAVGLGPTTNMSDGYPWGIWIAFDVVTGTALACGGYAVALLVYIFNRGKYHPLVRPALLVSALGYSVAAIGIVIDVGRPWFIWRIPISVGKWNLDSALLEVALCVMAYVAVLWIEVSPAFLEKWRDRGHGAWANFAGGAASFLDRILPWLVALGLLLPTMHQSSLGSVIMLAGPRLHPLWHTGWLPFLFLVSCIAMGYGAVVMESSISSRAFGRKREDAMLGTLGSVMSFVLLLWVVFRLGDIVVAGKTAYLFGSGLMSVLFWIEIVLFLIPGIMLRTNRVQTSIGCMFRSSLFILLGGAMYRFDSYLVAFKPGPGWSYFPSVTETVITLGLVCAEIMVFVWLVKSFPFLSGTTPVAAERK